MKNKVELLAPAGDLLSVKAAVQNGADAIYVGASSYSARASANNFTIEELKEVIKYAHIRDVKVHLALNTLIKNDEFFDAIYIAQKAYEYGIDAIIVQDLGLATKLIKDFPKLPIHASTQMTINNLNGVKTLERLGFKRIVLAREVSAQEIEYICRNTEVEIEAFIHGALCISYSGQCLMSSMIGGRSANRGKCAQACRLPYELLQDNTVIDNGYLLSPRDLCGLEYIPELIEAGVTSFKIEGRLKSPEYVAIVTKIYRKYIDRYLSGETFEIEQKDKEELCQAFNRGNFSTGHLDRNANQELVYKEKQNNMGIYIGNVANYNDKKGHITLNLNEAVALGDSITFENEPTKYRVSELMFQENNIPFACNNELITIGRMKGKIKPGDKIYKISSKRLFDSAKLTFSGKEYKKIKLQCKIIIKKDLPISVSVFPLKEYDTYKNISVNIKSDIIPELAINQPITKEKIVKQFSKTTDTPFEFAKIDVDLDEGLYIPHLSQINELRRTALEKIEFLVERKFTRVPVEVKKTTFEAKIHTNTKFSLLLSQVNPNFDYNKLEPVDRVYISLRCFRNVKNKNVIKTITSKFDTYIYLPAVINLNYLNLLDSFIASFVASYDIKGFVLSSIGEFAIIQNENYKNLEFISNYTLNVFNDYTIDRLIKNNISTVTLSPELQKNDIKNIKSPINKELIVYGKLKVMTLKYCLLGHSNGCYPKCTAKCRDSEHNYYLRDRMGFLFKVIPNSLQTLSNIYNSKTLSIQYDDLNIDYARIDILEENIDEINNVIRTVKSGKRFEGPDYTNGNINRFV